MGKISKSILERVNKEVRERTSFNQWKSTTEVIKWFKGMENKSRMVWLKFDIEAFYPSITKELLEKTLK